MVNVKLLKETMKEKEVSNEILAEKIGIDKSTFYRKIKEDSKSFNVNEAYDICKALNLTGDQAIKIFFNEELAETQETA